MITNSILAYGDQLGAQMTTLAEMLFIAKENNQQIVLFDELKNFRRGFQFIPVFQTEQHITLINRSGKLKNGIINLYCKQFKKKTKHVANYKRIYFNKFQNFFDRVMHKYIILSYNDFVKITSLKNNVHCDIKLLQLSTGNYNIHSGFGTYQDWKKYENSVLEMFTFRTEIAEKAETKLSMLRKEANVLIPNAKLIALHFRRGDYLILSSLNLSLDYYKAAISHFDKENCVFIIFSDDVEGCKPLIKEMGIKAIFSNGTSAAEDMCMMSRCDGNIIANSTFSFWGAMLNQTKDKLVVCPHDFIGASSPENMYINGNYYPDTWIDI